MPLEVIYQLWIPTAIAAVLGAILLRRRAAAATPGAPSSTTPPWPWAGALVIGLAAIALHIVALGTPRWPPTSADGRVLYAFAAATLVALVSGAFRSVAATAAAALVAGAAAAAITLWPTLQQPASDPGPLAHPFIPIALAAALVSLSATSLILLDRAGHRATAAFILTGLGLSSGAALAASGNLLAGQLAWGVAAAAAAATVVLLIKRPASLSTGLIVGAAALATALLIGNRYGSLGDRLGAARVLPPIIFGLCAPISLATDRLLARRLGPKAATIARIFAAALPAALALALSFDPPEEVPSEYQ